MAKLTNNKKNLSLINDLSLVEAVFDINELEDGEKELNFVKKLLEDEPELVTKLTDTKLMEKDKYKLVDGTFKEHVSDQMLTLLKNIFVKYTEKITVTAVTAVPMNESAQERLTNLLSEKLNKDVILENDVDKTIIGGVLLKVGDKVIDGTLKGELKTIRKSLKEVSLQEVEV